MNSEIIIYQNSEGNIKIDVRLEEETVWLTQEQIATLFGKAKSTINEHIKNILAEGELDEKVVVRKFRLTTKHGAIAGKTQDVDVNGYNLDLIISVGYRVKSAQGTQFRIWATQREKNLELTFSKEVMDDKEASVFPFFLKNEILERNQPLLFHMASRKNKVFDQFKKALQWFTHDLIPVMPNARPSGLTIHLEENPGFYQFASDVMQAFNTGIKSINVDTIPIEEFFGEDDKQQAERITAELKANPEKIRPFLTIHEEILFVLRQNKVVA
jgi:hypothetical protein